LKSIKGASVSEQRKKLLIRVILDGVYHALQNVVLNNIVTRIADMDLLDGTSFTMYLVTATIHKEYSNKAWEDYLDH